MTGRPIERLSAVDLTNLAVEAPDTPMHVGAVAVLDGRCLCEPDGSLSLAALRTGIERQLACVPELRRRLYRAGPLAGRPLWVDDPAFRIDRHVTRVGLQPPGAEGALLRLTEDLLAPLLDRAHPLWRLWFVTGLPDNRIAVVIALHHAIADGPAAVRLLTSLLDPSRTAGVPVGRPPWIPEDPPYWGTLFLDNVRARIVACGRLARHTRPVRLVSSLRGGWRVFTHARRGPRTSLNAPVGVRRRLAVLRLDLAEVKAAAHARDATVNDLVLDLAAGGLRALLQSRGESVDGLMVHAAVAVSQRNPQQMAQAGNRAGIVVVRLPLDQIDPVPRLDAIHSECVTVKCSQSPATERGLLVWLARSGLVRYLIRRQHLTNVVVSNVVGPRSPIRMLGAPVLDLVPVGVLAGNLAIAFLAFSYAGRLTITVRADADRCPDLPVLITAMANDWRTLRQSPADGGRLPVPSPARRPTVDGPAPAAPTSPGEPGNPTDERRE